MVSMDPSADISTTYRKTLNSKRSFGKSKFTDSPAYDGSEEDNDPLTDDGSINSGPARPPNTNLKVSSKKNRHQLAASTVSDSDGVDSPTYDGDIESSTTIHSQHPSAVNSDKSHHHTSSISTLNSVHTPHPAGETATTPGQERQSKTFLADPTPSSPSSDDQAPIPHRPIIITEPSVPAISRDAFNPAALTSEDIKQFVQNAIDGESERKYAINKPPTDRPIRVYADGLSLIHVVLVSHIVILSHRCL
jgi:choline-phosphate cytidylyltransferase